MKEYTISQFRQDIQNRYRLGYEHFFITSDGGVLCFPCAKEERRNILDSINRQCDDGWRVVACDCEANWDGVVLCDYCGKEVVS